MSNLYAITKSQEAIRQAAKALKLQRPLADKLLKVVATGEKKDEA